MKKNKETRSGIMYSTNPDFEFEKPEDDKEISSLPDKQKLYVSLDKKQRGGKVVTLVAGFTGKTGDIEILGKMLKTKCGVGGSVKDREILIQGDFRDKIIILLQQAGYKTIRHGG